MSILKSPYFLALDIDDPAQAWSVFDELKDCIGGVKIGPRLMMRDSQLVSRIAQLIPVFLDMKFYDIPTTLTSAVRAAYDLGATFVTIHAQNSPQALRDVTRLESELNQKRFFRVLAVTILTSYGNSDFPPNWKKGTSEELVQDLARYCLNQGLSGLVCSAYEVELIKKMQPHSFVVTPGIRLGSDNHLDQSRVMSPREALDKGADALVIGRSILNAASSLTVAQDLFDILK